MHQNKYAYKLEIDITKTRCPVCNHKHLQLNQNGDINCKCGFIASNTNFYVGGLRINNDLNFKIIKKHKKED